MIWFVVDVGRKRDKSLNEVSFVLNEDIFLEEEEIISVNISMQRSLDKQRLTSGPFKCLQILVNQSDAFFLSLVCKMLKVVINLL